MEQDYDKIFASNASSFQEWEDENYLKGWGFLGQTPPPYQLFDSLFKRLDLKTKELYDEQKKSDKKYVPLTGGTMTGLLKLFTGSTVPTPAEQDNSKQITNTEWVQTWVKSFVSKLNENLEVETQEDGHFSCPALGITGLMAQNGYICLGKLFGNLILQWGYCEIVDSVVYLPIQYTIKNLLSIISDTFGDISNSVMGSRPYGLQQIQVSQFSNISGNPETIGYFYFLSIGI